MPPPRIVPVVSQRDDRVSNRRVKHFRQCMVILFVCSSTFAFVGFVICMVTRKPLWSLPPPPYPPPAVRPPPPVRPPPRQPSTPHPLGPLLFLLMCKVGLLLLLVCESDPSLLLLWTSAFLAATTAATGKPPGCRDGSLTDLDAVFFVDFQEIEVNRVSSERCLGVEEGFVQAMPTDPQAHGDFYADVDPRAVNASTRLNYGCWFVHSPGSGIWLNLRKTLRGGDIADMRRLLGLPTHFSDGTPYQSNRLFCERAVALGYESIYWHIHGWVEVVACYGGCATQRVKGACPPIPVLTNEFDECHGTITRLTELRVRRPVLDGF